MAEKLTIDQAREIASNRLGRPLTKSEDLDLIAVVASGATLEQLAASPINGTDPTKGLYPEIGVSDEMLTKLQAAKALQVDQPAQRTVAPGGAWVPDQAGGGIPQPTYDPFSASDDELAASDFILGFQKKKVKKPPPLGGAQGRLELPEPEFKRVQEPVTSQVATFIGALVKWSPEQVANLQAALIQAGLLSQGEFVNGFADDKTLDSVRIAIQQAQQRDISLPELLDLRSRQLSEAASAAGGGGGGGGPSAPSAAEIGKDRYKSDLISTYMNNWGKPPPPGYIENIMKSGMNVYEFNAHERAKPAFRSSPRYQMERISAEGQLAQTFGALGV